MSSADDAPREDRDPPRIAQVLAQPLASESDEALIAEHEQHLGQLAGSDPDRARALATELMTRGYVLSMGGWVWLKAGPKPLAAVLVALEGTGPERTAEWLDTATDIHARQLPGGVVEVDITIDGKATRYTSTDEGLTWSDGVEVDR